MSLIEKLDNIIINFYRSHNYYWPSDVAMTQQTMDELKKEIHRRGFTNWDGKSFNHVSLRIFNDMENDTFVLSGAPELEHEVCAFCGIVHEKSAEWHRVDDNVVCKGCYEDIMIKVDVDLPDAFEIWKHNEGIRKKLNKRYLSYYGNYLFEKVFDTEPHLQDIINYKTMEGKNEE